MSCPLGTSRASTRTLCLWPLVIARYPDRAAPPRISTTASAARPGRRCLVGTGTRSGLAADRPRPVAGGDSSVVIAAHSWINGPSGHNRRVRDSQQPITLRCQFLRIRAPDSSTAAGTRLITPLAAGGSGARSRLEESAKSRLRAGTAEPAPLEDKYWAGSA